RAQFGDDGPSGRVGERVRAARENGLPRGGAPAGQDQPTRMRGGKARHGVQRVGRESGRIDPRSQRGSGGPFGVVGAKVDSSAGWAIDASTTAGKRLATAVPDVHTRATGLPPAFAIPSAEKPDDRSSRITCTRTPPWRARARAIGVDREPGDTHASVSPNRT